MLTILRAQNISIFTGIIQSALCLGASGPLRPEFIEYESESEPQIQTIKAHESIDSIIRAETTKLLSSDKLANAVADYPFSITSSNSSTSYLLFQAQKSTQVNLQESSIELPKSFSTQPTYSSFAQTTILTQSNLSYAVSFTSVEFYSASTAFSYAYSKEQPDASSTYSSSTSLFKEVSYSTQFTTTEIYKPSSSTKEQITTFEPAQSYIPSTSQVEITTEQKLESTYTSQPTAQLAYHTSSPLPESAIPQEPATQLAYQSNQPEQATTTKETNIYGKFEPSLAQLTLQESTTPVTSKSEPLQPQTSINSVGSFSIPLYEQTPEVKTLNLSDYQPTIETLETTQQIIQLKVDAQQLSQPEITNISNLENSEANHSTQATIYQPQESSFDTATISTTPYITLESAVEQPETKVSQNFKSTQSNLQSLESAFNPILSNLKHTNNSLYKVHENGENYRRDLPELVVTQSHLDSIKDYKVITKDGKEIDISNSVLALVHSHYKSLGIAVEIESLVSSIYGQVDTGVAVEIKDLQSVANEFSLSTTINVGTIVEVNGEEPEKGTVPLNRYGVNLGDRVQIAAVAQGLYHKKSKKDSTIDHLSTTEGIKSKYSSTDNCAPADYKKEGGFSSGDTCVPGGIIIKNSNDSAIYLAKQEQIDADSAKRYVLEKRNYNTQNWTMNVEKNGKPEIVQTDFKDYLTLDEWFEIQAETKNLHVKRKMINGQVTYTGVYGFDHLAGEFQVMVYKKDGSSFVANNAPQLKIENGDMAIPMYVGKNQ